MKKGLLIVAAVLMLAGAVQAGEIKTHTWPCQFVAQDLMTITVSMDIGYWIRVKNQSNYKIKLTQAAGSYHTYDGCVNIPVECNFNATLSVTVTKLVSIGNLTATIDPATISPGTTTVKVCAHLTDANLAVANAGQSVDVATITIRVVPTV